MLGPAVAGLGNILGGMAAKAMMGEDPKKLSYQYMNDALMQNNANTINMLGGVSDLIKASQMSNLSIINSISNQAMSLLLPYMPQAVTSGLQYNIGNYGAQSQAQLGKPAPVAPVAPVAPEKFLYNPEDKSRYPFTNHNYNAQLAQYNKDMEVYKPKKAAYDQQMATYNAVPQGAPVGIQRGGVQGGGQGQGQQQAIPKPVTYGQFVQNPSTAQLGSPGYTQYINQFNSQNGTSYTPNWQQDGSGISSSSSSSSVSSGLINAPSSAPNQQALISWDSIKKELSDASAWAVKTGTEEVQNSAAAKGLLNSGNAMAAINERAAGQVAGMAFPYLSNSLAAYNNAILGQNQIYSNYQSNLNNAMASIYNTNTNAATQRQSIETGAATAGMGFLGNMMGALTGQNNYSLEGEVGVRQGINDSASNLLLSTAKNNMAAAQNGFNLID